MANQADCLIALPGGKGTADMLDVARRLNLNVFDAVTQLSTKQLSQRW
jgi:predicted Rossmann-fold nucleotide-binding protein